MPDPTSCAWPLIFHTCSSFPNFVQDSELTLPKHTLDTHNGTRVTLTSLQLYKIFHLRPRMCSLHKSDSNMIPKYEMYF